MEKARPDFKAVLQEDRQAEADAELSAAEAAADARQEEHVAPASGKPVRVMRPDRKKVCAAMPLDCSPTRLQCFRPAVHARPYTFVVHSSWRKTESRDDQSCTIVWRTVGLIIAGVSAGADGGVCDTAWRRVAIRVPAVQADTAAEHSMAKQRVPKRQILSSTTV